MVAGIWLSKDAAANIAEINGAVKVALNHDCDMLCVGSEALLRGDLQPGTANSPAANLSNSTTLSTLIGYIKAVRQAVQSAGTPLAYDDTYQTLLNNPAVCQQTDYLLANIYPYWEGVSIGQAASFTQQKYSLLTTAYPGKQIWIGEAGWPTDGDAMGSAVALGGCRQYLSLLYPGLGKGEQRARSLV